MLIKQLTEVRCNEHHDLLQMHYNRGLCRPTPVSETG